MNRYFRKPTRTPVSPPTSRPIRSTSGFAMNGETGKVVGDLPVDKGKFPYDRGDISFEMKLFD